MAPPPPPALSLPNPAPSIPVTSISVWQRGRFDINHFPAGNHQGLPPAPIAMLPMFVSTLVIQMAPSIPPPRKKVEEKQNPQTEVEDIHGKI